MKLNKEKFLTWLKEQPIDMKFDYTNGAYYHSMPCPIAAFLKDNGVNVFSVAPSSYIIGELDTGKKFPIPDWFHIVNEIRFHTYGTIFTVGEFLECFKLSDKLPICRE